MRTLLFDPFSLSLFGPPSPPLAQIPSPEAIRYSYGARARPFEQGRFHFHSALVSTVDAPRPTAEQLGTKMTDEEIAKLYGIVPRCAVFGGRGQLGTWDGNCGHWELVGWSRGSE
jgi:hypothetical protein